MQIWLIETWHKGDYPTVGVLWFPSEESAHAYAEESKMFTRYDAVNIFAVTKYED